MNAPTTTCPVCAGEIHAIAGRCKHCKADLGRWRRAEPRADRSARIRQGEADLEGAAEEVSRTTSPPARSGSPPAGGRPALRSVWSRKWPAVVMGVALFAIGVSVGILAERWRRPPSEPNASPGTASNRTGASPRRIPDRMPRPILPGPPPAPPASPPPSGRSGPAPPPGDADRFVSALADALCDKLDECGLIEGNARAMCGLFADTLEGRGATGRSGGDCDFDGDAAKRCLQAIESLRCDAAASTRVLEWLSAAESLEDCSNALACE